MAALPLPRRPLQTTALASAAGTSRAATAASPPDCAAAATSSWLVYSDFDEAVLTYVGGDDQAALLAWEGAADGAAVRVGDALDLTCLLYTSCESMAKTLEGARG